MPALFTRIEGAPCCLSTWSTKRFTLFVSFTSRANADTSAPSAARLAIAALHFAGSRAPITTWTSAFASCRAISRPIPRLPPVTMAILLAGMGQYDNDMPKLLRAVRLDDSDEHVFRSCGAARDGEPVVTGGYAVCDFANAPHCDPPCHCQASFVAVASRARCSIAEVVEASDAELE